MGNDLFLSFSSFSRRFFNVFDYVSELVCLIRNGYLPNKCQRKTKLDLLIDFLLVFDQVKSLIEKTLLLKKKTRRRTLSVFVLAGEKLYSFNSEIFDFQVSLNNQ